ncbi:MAG TPA: hypothetical protein VGM90_28575 [Kofleriaceae bacterium]|jgi:hypothetical protein
MKRALLFVWSFAGIGTGCGSSGSNASSLRVSQHGDLVRGSITALQLTPGDDEFFGTDSVLDAAQIELAASPGLTLQLTRATAPEIDVLVAVDASAPLGTVDLEVRIGAEPTRFRAPATVVDGAPITELAEKLDVNVPEGGSTLVWLAPGAPLDYVVLDAQGTSGEPVLAVLDGDGRFLPDLASASHREVVVDEPRAVIVRDRSGHAGSFHLTADRVALRTLAAAGGNATIASALPVGLPDAEITDAMFAGADDVHAYAVDLDTSAIGLQLTAATLGEDNDVDTRISVIADDRESLVGFPSTDRGALDTVTTPTIAVAGRYYVRVTPGSLFTPEHARYSLALVLR